MRGLRSLRRLGAGLGLFALLLQLALAFAHIHPDDLRGTPGIVAIGESQQTSGDPDRHPSGAPHDDCPICAVMHLAGTIVLPHAPALAVSARFTVAAFSAADFAPTIVPRRPAFRTRAPPTA